MGLYKFVRSLDIFAQTVGVRYREDSQYRTFCGGMCSVLAWLIVLFYSSTEITNYVRGNNYNESIVFETLKYDNEVAYNVADTQAMIAFQLVATQLAVDTKVDVSVQYKDYLMFYFLYTKKGTDGTDLNKVPAINCLTKYADAEFKLQQQF